MKKTPVTHMTPLLGHSATPCCDKTPFELPIGDRITREVSRVTCGKDKTK